MGSLLFARAPIVDDELTVIAETPRVRLLPFTLVAGASKLGQYLVVAIGALAWVWQ